LEPRFALGAGNAPLKTALNRRLISKVALELHG